MPYGSEAITSLKNNKQLRRGRTKYFSYGKKTGKAYSGDKQPVRKATPFVREQFRTDLKNHQITERNKWFATLAITASLAYGFFWLKPEYWAFLVSCFSG